MQLNIRRLTPLVRATAIASVAFFCGVLIAGTAMLAPRDGLVTTNDGRTFEGQITERGGEVIVRIKGIESTLARDDVATIVYGTFAERFERALASLAADDVAGRVALGRDALGRAEFALATQATDAALDIDPLDRSARQLMDLIQQQQRAAGSSTPRPAVPSEDNPDDPDDDPKPKVAELISKELMNTIRQSELRPGDDRVRIRFANNVRKRYVDSTANLSYAQFIRQSDVEQALEILQNGSKDMTADVIVASDPPTLLEFNRRIQTAVLQGCATSQCHGGGTQGVLPLIAPARSPEETFINFHTLVTYQTRVGEQSDTGSLFSGPSVRRMIDRESPERSLLLEFGLPKNRTENPHPEIKGYNGIFRDTNDPQYRLILRWVDELRKPSPDYKLAPASTQPAN